MTTLPQTLVLPRNVVTRILTQAQQQPETETCGLLSARDGDVSAYYPVKNIAADPASRFEMEPQHQIAAMKSMRENNEQLFAVVHSHPHSPAAPSAADVAEYGYPDAYYLIVSLNVKGVLEIRGFRQVDGEMRPVELHYAHGDEDAG